MQARHTDDESTRIDTEPGLSPTRQVPVSPAATVDVADKTVTELWRSLFARDAVRDVFVRAVRALADGRTATDLLDALDERDVPAHLHSLIDAVARGDRRRAWHLVSGVVPSLGQGQSTVGELLATAGLFDAVPSTPTLAVRIGPAFRERRREQREDICRLLATLSRSFDVRLIVTGVTRAWLSRAHREDLPGVSEWRNTDPDRGPLADVVDDALATLDPDSREVAVLETLADAPGQTLPYRALYSAFQTDNSRVRQCIGRLSDLGLVEPFGPGSDRKADLLDAGRELLSEVGQQITLSDAVSETPQNHQQAVYAQTQDGGDGDGQPFRTAYLRPADHAASVACGSEGRISLVEHPEEPEETHRTRWVSYDDDREEAVVDVRATDTLHYTVSLATALASPEFIDRVLPAGRLDAVDDTPAILRDARCIGWLSDETLSDGQALRDALVDAGRDLADLTRDLQHGEYGDRNALRSDIVRTAHGLAGSVVHLLDAVGVELTRVVRVPGGLSFDKLDNLAESVGISTAIQSQYGAYAVYRQLFESREDKRQAALSPGVDAADPVGELIGSLVVRGPDIERLRPSLAEHVARPADVVDDAPELSVRVPIQSVGRRAFATAATRVLSSKNLRQTRDAVALCRSLAGSPYDVARALQQLDTEEDARDVRPDEIRYALATLSAERCVPPLPPTVGAIVSALLAAEKRLTQTALSERAGVSTESIRRHRDRLASLGLLDHGERGYRLSLSFRTREERRSPVTPDVVGGRFIMAVDSLLVDALPPERYADPEDPVGQVLFAPQDPWGIPEESDLSPWVDLAGALTGTDPPDRDVSVSFGPSIQQTPLPADKPGRHRA